MQLDFHRGLLIRLCQIGINEAGNVLVSERGERRVARVRTGNRIAGPSPGQVTDLAGAVHTFPEMRFPAPSSSSPSSTFPAASHRSDKVELSARQSKGELHDM
jgi:hypothetical protein